MKLFNLVTLTLALCLSSQVAFSQCATWKGNQEDVATDAHSIYRGMVKNGQLDKAYEHWEKVFEIAPAADGIRDSHFDDGIQILKHKLKSETDEAKKKVLQDRIVGLYNGVIECLEAESIVLEGVSKDARISFFAGRMAYDMFYEYKTPYPEVIKNLKLSIAKGGNDVEYIILDPYARIVVYEFKEERMTKEEARKLYTDLNDIADYNIKNNEAAKAGFVQAKESMNGQFKLIEDFIFDCEYWKVKLRPDYDANPDDLEVIKTVYGKLRQQSCDLDDPFMAELSKKHENFVKAENAAKLAEFEKNNPAYLARKAYDAGDYQGALAKYKESLNSGLDPDKMADVYFGMASIEGRKLGHYTEARNYARKAAELRPNWGNPWMLIGDIYAKGARNCGDSFMQRCAILAAIDKYKKAKSVDPSVTDEANKRIGNYSSMKPDKAEAFMMGYKSGQTVKVGCWIGETVTLRF